MDYDEYVNKDRYVLNIEFEGKKIPEKTKELIYSSLQDEWDSLCKRLELDGSFGEGRKDLLPRHIIESI